MKERLLFTGLLAGALLLAGCSYHLVRESRKSLPGELESVFIPLARNGTIEAGLEDTFTQELIRTLRADGRINLAGPSTADARLQCELKKLRTTPASYSEQGRILVENVVLEAECRLIIPETDSTVWSSGVVRASEEYPLGTDYLNNERQRAVALREVCRDISESVRSLLLDSF
ncbi:MAG: LPS assembly lipoprotein LptE [bacterium]